MRPIEITGERLLLALDWLALLTSHYGCVGHRSQIHPNPRGFATGRPLERFVKERFPKLALFADCYDGAEKAGCEPFRDLRIFLRNNPRLRSAEVAFGEEIEGAARSLWGLFRDDLERFFRMIASGEIAEADLME